jgi:hypothetical protein
MGLRVLLGWVSFAQAFELVLAYASMRVEEG